MDTQLRPFRHRFELGGGTIPECRVTAGPIIEHFEPLEDLLLRFVPCSISSMKHELRFEPMEEALHDRIVPAIRASTHADRDAMAGGAYGTGGRHTASHDPSGAAVQPMAVAVRAPW
jgi:hypothetical protein